MILICFRCPLSLVAVMPWLIGTFFPAQFTERPTREALASKKGT